jgi:hypothetical protein
MNATRPPKAIATIVITTAINRSRATVAANRARSLATFSCAMAISRFIASLTVFVRFPVVLRMFPMKCDPLSCFPR